MAKVFGYPDFDENGVRTLSTYDNEYSAMNMDVRVYKLAAGTEKELSETARTSQSCFSRERSIYPQAVRPSRRPAKMSSRKVPMQHMFHPEMRSK